MKNVSFIIVISVLIVSCGGRKKHDTENNQSEIKTFLALDKSNNINSVLDIFDLVKIVELKTDDNNLIGNAKDVRIARDNIYIHDNIRGIIYRFGKEGDFLNTIGKKGRGPGEFSIYGDFCVDDTNREIIILDNRKKIVRYKFSGEFIKEVNIPINALKIALLKGDRYLLDAVGYSYNGRFKSFFILNKKGEIVDEGLSYSGIYAQNLCSVSTGIQGSLNDYSMCFPFNDTIYRYTNNTFSPKYVFDFENQKLPEDIFENCRDGIEAIKKTKELDKVLYIHNYLETDNLCYAVYVKGDNALNSLIYNKKNQKTYYYNGKNISDILTDYFVSVTDKNELVYIFNPYQVATNDFKFRMRYMDSKYGDNESYQKIKAEILKVSENDNPVLMFFKLEEDID